MMRPAVLWSALLLFSSTGAAQADKCKPSNPPDAWSAQGTATPIAATVDPAAIPRLNLVVFRHAEKPLRDDGLMAEDGNLGAEAEQRLARLPEQLLKDFGCPDFLVAANPAVKMLNKKTGQYFNYIRPLATIEPLSIKLNYPVWTPYGYNQNDLLARDLLGDKAFRPSPDGAPKTVFLAWERQNIRKLYQELVQQGKLKDLAGATATIDGVDRACDALPQWEQCDFDSVWMIKVRPAGVCLTRRVENLNAASFQKQCKGAESVSDTPRN